ncbi:MAG TPA: glycosyl hydrolase family 28-related protein, partial [Candidatus Acidoferrum sp.]|nr:glycosyl hydrolase family 28-related protein [Candidatus Acidoferrum sp.]
MKMALRWVVWAGLLLSFSTFAGPSVYQQAPNDARAITVVAANDGKQDASAAIQAALDSAEAKGAGGIVLLPAGRYRLTKTLYLWPGVRLIGVGASRPVLLLADNTPGFQQGVKHMVIFTGRGPEAKSKVPFPPAGSVPFRDDIADANSGTFYSAIDNIDIEIGKGNAAAAAIRFHAAQHAFLRHMEFQLGSAFAGIYQAGNYVEDLHFHGGRYGVVSEKTSDAWQFALIDSSFDGQRDAAIREHEASLTLINVAISNTKTGIDIDQGYGDWLWGKNVRFDHVTRAGVVISNENNVYTQIGFDHALASNTPTFALMRDSGRKLEPAGRNYRVDEFTYGLTLPQFGALGDYTTRLRSTPLGTVPPLPTAMRALPAMKEWTNVRDLGAKGDGTTDDTAALQAAIDAHRVLWFPSGFYRVTDRLMLKPDTVLIGLHPGNTQIMLADGSAPYQGVGAPRALIEAPKGGDNIV